MGRFHGIMSMVAFAPATVCLATQRTARWDMLDVRGEGTVEYGETLEQLLPFLPAGFQALCRKVPPQPLGYYRLGSRGRVLLHIASVHFERAAIFGVE